MVRENGHVRQKKRVMKTTKINNKNLKIDAKNKAASDRREAVNEEEELDNLLAEFQKADIAETKLVSCERPSPRSLFSFVAHPIKDELLLTGGETFDGKHATMFDDFFVYNIAKNDWKKYQPEGGSGPPPRSGHTTVVRPKNGGELWMFGGQFSGKTASQYRHYNDLWVFYFKESRWEKITLPNAPTPRSGHRMVIFGTYIFIFGGFFDNGKGGVPKFYNDVHFFNLEAFEWQKISFKNTVLTPSPRSTSLLFVLGETVHVIGGFSFVKTKTSEKGMVHDDAWVFEKNSSTIEGDDEWTWRRIRPQLPKMHAGVNVIQRPGTNFAFSFGGVHDEQTDDVIRGTFINDLWSINVETSTWKNGTVKIGMERKELQERQENINQRKIQEAKKKRKIDAKRKKFEEKAAKNAKNPKLVKNAKNSKANEASESSEIPLPFQKDALFEEEKDSCKKQEKAMDPLLLWPTPRMRPGLAMKGKVLYLFGGDYEAGDREIAYSDLYSLDTQKMDKWVLQDDCDETQDWYSDSDSSSDDEDDE